MSTTMNGSLVVEDMDYGELKDTILYLHRNGRLVPYPHGKVMGLACRLKAGSPTANDLSTVRRLIANARHDYDDPVILIDDEDDGGKAREQDKNYAEF